MHFQYLSIKALMLISFTLLLTISIFILVTQSTFLLVDLKILQVELYFRLSLFLF